MSVFNWRNEPCTISAEFITRGKVQANSSAMVERRREEGRDVSTILGLSKKADQQRKPHGGAYSRGGVNGRPIEPKGMSGRLRSILAAWGPLTRKELAEKSGITYDKISGLLKNDVDKGRVVIVHREGEVLQFQIGVKA